MSTREDLAKELYDLIKSIPITNTTQNPVYKIADFILEDRKRIVEPLVKIGNEDGWDMEELLNARVETLKNAGIQQINGLEELEFPTNKESK